MIRVAHIIAQSRQRSTDLACRYGGEEFGVILPHTDMVGAFHVADKIREAVLQQKIPHEKSNVSQYVTLSFGVASMIPNHDLNPERLIALADEALYLAKHQGRNRVGCMVNVDHENPVAINSIPCVNFAVE